jgi:hypothetical protein
MTAKQIELKEKLNYTIPYLSEKQLYVIITIAEEFVSTKKRSENEDPTQKSTLPPRNPKFGGRKISDEVAALRMGYSIDVSDEDLNKMRYECLIDKYK